MDKQIFLPFYNARQSTGGALVVSVGYRGIRVHGVDIDRWTGTGSSRKPGLLLEPEKRFHLLNHTTTQRYSVARQELATQKKHTVQGIKIPHLNEKCWNVFEFGGSSLRTLFLN